ncbi:MAG: acetyl-CoA carboxylase biotin carboxylase subunit, partial [Clostridium sp. 27_14]
MLQKILIANRGEIAVRIIRACREMGIRTVAVYSEADKNSLHKTLADEAICIGPAASSKSYLNMKAILEAACLTGADSIHPGFGFLSENASFAKICNDMGIKFIGPSGDLINLLGNKSKAKETMKKAGVPVVPGSEGLIKSKEEAIELAEKIKYPVILKASAGGGGRGIRIAYSKEELEKSYDIVKQEAKISFGDDSIYLEKFIENPRHVEIQILADEHGNCIHLGERDCSIQRRNQKIIEETPSMAINDKTRKKMGQVAVKAVKEIGYTNVGTIEFLVDKNQDFYFMEMNTRVQVEHPITEEQIKIASGQKMLLKQEDIKFTGHVMEARINAENSDKNFMPCPGKITGLHLPGGNGIRVDTAIYAGYTVPANYDAMIAK